MKNKTRGILSFLLLSIASISFFYEVFLWSYLFLSLGCFIIFQERKGKVTALCCVCLIIGIMVLRQIILRIDLFHVIACVTLFCGSIFIMIRKKNISDPLIITAILIGLGGVLFMTGILMIIAWLLIVKDKDIHINNGELFILSITFMMGILLFFPQLLLVNPFPYVFHQSFLLVLVFFYFLTPFFLTLFYWIKRKKKDEEVIKWVLLDSIPHLTCLMGGFLFTGLFYSMISILLSWMEIYVLNLCFGFGLIFSFVLTYKMGEKKVSRLSFYGYLIQFFVVGTFLSFLYFFSLPFQKYVYALLLFYAFFIRFINKRQDLIVIHW